MRRAPVVLVFLLAAWAVSALAQQGTENEAVVITAENRSAHEEAARGEPRADDTIRQGDTIRYTLTFTNPTDGPVRDVVLQNPLPEGLRFVAGSAQADRDDARAEYSVDGGASFSPQPMIEAVEAGKTVRRPASPEQYTDVRWTVEGWIQPGSRVIASYDAHAPSSTPEAPAEPSGSGRNDGP